MGDDSQWEEKVKVVAFVVNIKNAVAG